MEKIKSFFKEHRRVILCIATCGIALLCSCFLGGFLSSKRSYKYISGGLTGFGKSVAAGFLSSGLHSTVRDTEDSSKALQEQLNALEKELIALEKESQDLEISWEKLTEQLKAYKDTKKISQEVYDTLIVLAETAFDKTEVYEGFIVKQSETIADQDVELAKLKSKAGFQQFFKLNGLVGFDLGIPTWSAGIGYGFKFGNGLVFEVGANYEVGNLLKPIDFTEPLSLDKVTASVSIGVLL